jgi:hypothetical protein
VVLERRFVEFACTDPGTKNGLYSIDEPALDDSVAAIHAELDRTRHEFRIGHLGVAFQKAHIQKETLVDHRVDFVEAEGEGLFEPERVVHDLTLYGRRFFFVRGPTHLLTIGVEAFVDLTALDDDNGGLRDAEIDRLPDEEQGAEQQEVEEG